MSSLITSVPTATNACTRVTAPFDHNRFAWSPAYADEVVDSLLIIEARQAVCGKCGQPADLRWSNHHAFVAGTHGQVRGCGTVWRVVATTDHTACARQAAAETGKIDAGIADYTSIDPGDRRHGITLSKAS